MELPKAGESVGGAFGGRPFSFPLCEVSPMRLDRVLHVLPAVVAVAVCALFGVGLVLATQEARAHDTLLASMRGVQVIPPRGIPLLKQESVDLAMALYTVGKGPHVAGPVLDGELEDRGLTTGGTLSMRKTVTVGPSAFTSWAVLGSTLGHEIEVHARQSFFLVVARDRFAEVQLSARRRIGRFVPFAMPRAREGFENDGTWRAEREAYEYELSNAKRYGLSPAEARSIRYVMNYYYPKPGTARDAGSDDAALEESRSDESAEVTTSGR